VTAAITFQQTLQCMTDLRGKSVQFCSKNTQVTSVYEAQSAIFAQTFEYIIELRVLEHTRINITNPDLGTKQL